MLMLVVMFVCVCVCLLTVNNMVLFSCRLVGWTPAAPFADRRCSSGERPFSSSACRDGKLGSLRKNRALFPPPSAPSFAPFSNCSTKKHKRVTSSRLEATTCTIASHTTALPDFSNLIGQIINALA